MEVSQSQKYLKDKYHQLKLEQYAQNHIDFDIHNKIASPIILGKNTLIFKLYL